MNIGKDLESPLHLAARICCEELATLLMDYGANIYIKDSDDKRPVDLVDPNSPLALTFREREGESTLPEFQY